MNIICIDFDYLYYNVSDNNNITIIMISLYYIFINYYLLYMKMHKVILLIKYNYSTFFDIF